MINWPRLILNLAIAAAAATLGGAIVYFTMVVPMERDMALAVSASAQAQLDEVAKRKAREAQQHERERIADEKRNKDQLFVNDLLAGLGGVRFPAREICGDNLPAATEAGTDRDDQAGRLRERMDESVARFKRGVEERIIRRAEQLNLDARRANAANGLPE